MKIKISKKQRERGQRIINRFKKLLKIAVLSIAAYYFMVGEFFQVLKDQLAALSSSDPDPSLLDEDYIDPSEVETAFIDRMYGDLESLIQQRRKINMLSGTN